MLITNIVFELRKLFIQKEELKQSLACNNKTGFNKDLNLEMFDMMSSNVIMKLNINDISFIQNQNYYDARLWTYLHLSGAVVHFSLATQVLSVLLINFLAPLLSL